MVLEGNPFPTNKIFILSYQNQKFTAMGITDRQNSMGDRGGASLFLGLMACFEGKLMISEILGAIGHG
jgi:hypothetical protein